VIDARLTRAVSAAPTLPLEIVPIFAIFSSPFFEGAISEPIQQAEVLIDESGTAWMSQAVRGRVVGLPPFTVEFLKK